MKDSPLNDAVARQYEIWPYPRPADELRQSTSNNSYLFYFPTREYWEGIDILVAGCGTNQAAQLALGDRHARVVGIDVSQAALANERRLKEKYGLANPREQPSFGPSSISSSATASCIT